MKKMLFHVVTGLCLITGVTGDAQTADTKTAEVKTFDGFKFSLLDLGNGHGESKVESDGKNGFKITVKNTDANNYGVVIADFQYAGNDHQQLAFQLKGADNGNAELSVELLYIIDKQWHAAKVSGLSTQNSDFDNIVLDLNKDFKLPAGTYNFVQIKFGFGGNRNGKDAVSVLEIKDVRLVDKNEKIPAAK